MTDIIWRLLEKTKLSRPGSSPFAFGLCLFCRFVHVSLVNFRNSGLTTEQTDVRLKVFILMGSASVRRSLKPSCSLLTEPFKCASFVRSVRFPPGHFVKGTQLPSSPVTLSLFLFFFLLFFQPHNKQLLSKWLMWNSSKMWNIVQLFIFIFFLIPVGAVQKHWSVICSSLQRVQRFSQKRWLKQCRIAATSKCDRVFKLLIFLLQREKNKMTRNCICCFFFLVWA